VNSSHAAKSEDILRVPSTSNGLKETNYTFAYYSRGNAYYNHGNLDKAISDYNEAIRLDPNLALAGSKSHNAVM
jgi:tetratricopeptide (TPR) repeat protein